MFPLGQKMQSGMGRRRFDHLVIEVSLAVGRRIKRYDLWMHLHHVGLDPEALSQDEVIAFCDGDLRLYLGERGHRISPRSVRRLRRTLRRFDPGTPTLYENVAGSESGS